MTDQSTPWSGYLPALVALASGVVALWPVPQLPAIELAPDQREGAPMPPAGDWVPRLVARTGILERPSRIATQVARPLAGYDLIGLVETDGRRLALLSGGGATQTLQVSESLDGFILMQILPDRVVFERDGEETVLRLER